MTIYNYSNLEDFIRKNYFYIGISEPEQLDELFIAERLGIELYYFDEPSEAVVCNGNHYIFINKCLTKQQKWQDFGHELGHLLRHAGNQSRMPPLFREYQEWQADSFMYHFCIPTFLLERIQLPFLKKEAISMLSETFNVEYKFAERRLDMWLNKKHSFLYFQQIKELAL